MGIPGGHPRWASQVGIPGGHLGIAHRYPELGVRTVPRGVAIPEIREQLFRAAERVLERDGPSGLSGRAVTREVGCATGLLYNHFGDLDAFLAEFLLDRWRAAIEGATALVARAGEETVVENLTDAALELFPQALVLSTLMASRPSLMPRMREARAAHAPDSMGSCGSKVRSPLTSKRRSNAVGSLRRPIPKRWPKPSSPRCIICCCARGCRARQMILPTGCAGCSRPSLPAQRLADVSSTEWNEQRLALSLPGASGGRAQAPPALAAAARG